VPANGAIPPEGFPREFHVRRKSQMAGQILFYLLLAGQCAVLAYVIFLNRTGGNASRWLDAALLLSCLGEICLLIDMASRRGEALTFYADGIQVGFTRFRRQHIRWWNWERVHGIRFRQARFSRSGYIEIAIGQPSKGPAFRSPTGVEVLTLKGKHKLTPEQYAQVASDLNALPAARQSNVRILPVGDGGNLSFAAA